MCDTFSKTEIAADDIFPILTLFLFDPVIFLSSFLFTLSFFGITELDEDYGERLRSKSKSLPGVAIIKEGRPFLDLRTDSYGARGNPPIADETVNAGKLP